MRCRAVTTRNRRANALKELDESAANDKNS
jgi:hypothetical protein